MRILRIAACIVAMVSASACKARAALDIEIRRDGSGVLNVRTDLDRVAREEVGIPIEPVTVPFRDLEELESFFDGPRGPDLVGVERDGSHLEMTIDLAGFMHEALGDTGSALIAGAPAVPSNSDFDATLSIRAEGSVREHNADADRNGTLVWRLWPIPDQPALVSIDLGRPPSRSPAPLLATGAAAIATVLGYARFRHRR